MTVIPSWWFYFVDVVGSLSGVVRFCSRLGIVLLVLQTIVSICSVFVLADPCWDEDEVKNFGKALVKVYKLLIIFTFIFVMINVFLPSQETMITMMVNKFVTYENIEIVTDAVKEGVEYIMSFF